MDTKIDIQQILDLMPHRYPLLLIDRIIDIVPGEKIVALKNVTFNEPFFQGHFPDAPIMPGVLIVEAMAQAGAMLYLDSLHREDRNYIFYFMGLDKVRFRKPVVPGDQMILESKILRIRSNAIKMAATAVVDNALVAEAELLATMGEKS
jgi:beta-hydroxyacyl-ACP dehydratase FabZ